MIPAKRINTIIVEDELHAIELLEDVLANIPEINNLKSFGNANDALDFLTNGVNVDMIFLDIEMPGKNGFDFLKDLIKMPHSPCIVFTTGFAEYSIQAIKASVFDYLLKPIGIDDIRETIRRYKICAARENMKGHYQDLVNRVEPDKILKFRSLNGITLVHTEDVAYIRSNGNYSIVHQIDCKKEVITMQLGVIEKMLPGDQYFRISRQLLINLRYLTKVDTKNKLCYLKYDHTEIKLSGSGKKLKALVDSI
jgi:two-component system LytT family response regulator